MRVKKPKLIPGWKQCMRWYSQQINTALISLAPIWAFFPQDWREQFMANPTAVTTVVVTVSVLGILGFVGRIVDQGGAGAEAKH